MKVEAHKSKWNNSFLYCIVKKYGILGPYFTYRNSAIKGSKYRPVSIRDFG